MNISTGLVALDRLTNGLPAGLVVVTGKAGVGKTAFVLGLMRSAAIHHSIKALMFSPGESKYALMERMLAAESGISGAQLRQGCVPMEDWKEHVYPAAGRISGAPLRINDSRDLTVSDLRARILASQGPLGLIVIDHPAGFAMGPRDLRELASLAHALPVPVVLTREWEEGRAVAPEIDLQVTIRRCGSLSCLDDHEWMNFVVEKNEHGSTGTVQVRFHGGCARFESTKNE